MQTIQGHVRDRDQVQRQVEEWRKNVKPGALGYLGSTSGFTDDDQLFVLVRFESLEAAEANSIRPEQSAWWEKMAPAFDGEVTFTDCPVVDTMLGGGSDLAGFVQVMQGRAKDPEAMRTAGSAMETELRAARPDVLGGVVGWHGDRYFTQVIYFESEEAARTAESQQSGAEGADEWAKMLDGALTFLDLHQPDYD